MSNTEDFSINFAWKCCLITPLSNFSSKRVIEIVNKYSKKSPNTYQIINPIIIVSERQINSAIYQSLKAFVNNRNVTRNLALEIIVRLTGTTQIEKALDITGITDKNKDLLLIGIKTHEKDLVSEMKEIIDEFDFEYEYTFTLHFPINNNYHELALFYGCSPKIDELEKAALEKIAAIEVV
ncbi:MAG: KEOPS complex subunit Cgi121 [Candidatus Heimdallarchaeaceae archaeon]